MIRSFYYHGAEVPATDLTRDQMQAALADAGGVLWIDLLNANPKETEETLTQVFEFHPLTIDECIQGVRRPKLDNYDSYAFFVVYVDDQATPVEDINTVELDVFLGANFVVTHHPLPVPAIDRISNEIMEDESLMNRGADTLTYEILREVASDYKPTVDYLSAALAGVEIEVVTAPTDQTLRRIHELRHDTLKIKRVLTAQQEIVSTLATGDVQPVHGKNRRYFRELADRFSYMVETTETLDESIRSALQTHLSVTYNRTNNLLRFVAAVVTILLPLTLLGVLYATNIMQSPALSSPSVETAILVFVLLLSAILAFYIYRRG